MHARTLHRRTWLAAAAQALVLAVIAPDAVAGSTENQLLAERLCVFPKFIEWPPKKFLQPDSPFVIGIVGASNLAAQLREIIQDRRLKDRRIVVKQIELKEELPACHMVFIGASEREHLDPLLREVRRQGVLTVGESENFLPRGGIINLVQIGDALRFQVNFEAAKRERLNISSKLLQLALPQDLAPEASSPGR